MVANGVNKKGEQWVERVKSGVRAVKVVALGVNTMG